LSAPIAQRIPKALEAAFIWRRSVVSVVPAYTIPEREEGLQLERVPRGLSPS